MRSSHSQSCRKGHDITSRTKGGGETIWVSPVTLGGCCGRTKLSPPWKYPSPVGRSARDRELQWLRGECNRKKRGRPAQTALATVLPFPARDDHLPVWAALNAEFLGFSRQTPGRGLDLAMRRQSWRAWNMESHLGMCKGWSPDPQQKPHCQQVQKEGSAPPYKPYSQHANSGHRSATTIFSNCLYTAAGQKSELIPGRCLTSVDLHQQLWKHSSWWRQVGQVHLSWLLTPP